MEPNVLISLFGKHCFNQTSHAASYRFPPRGRTILDTCPWLSISALHWYPTQINGHTFVGRNTDTFQLPDALLEVPPPPGAGTTGGLDASACRRLQLTEFTTEHWFLTNDKTTALSGKVRRPDPTQWWKKTDTKFYFLVM